MPGVGRAIEPEGRVGPASLGAGTPRGRVDTDAAGVHGEEARVGRRRVRGGARVGGSTRRGVRRPVGRAVVAGRLSLSTARHDLGEEDSRHAAR